MGITNYEYRHTETYKGTRIDKRGHTEAEVAAKVQKAKDNIDQGLLLRCSGTPVNKWWEQYRDNYIDGKVSDRTYEDRERIYNKRIKPYIGSMQIRDVRPLHCQEILNEMAGYSKDYIDKTCQLMFNMFKKAKSEKMIIENPAEDLTRPQAENGHGRPCTLQERSLMLLALEDHPEALWVKCILYLGMRPGETALLQHKHINYDAQLVYIEGTKTAAAKRIVPAPPELLAELKEIKTGSNGYLFTNAYGDFMQKKARSKAWAQVVRRMNIIAGCKVYRNQVQEPVVPEDFIPYCCRHSFATDAKDANVPYRIRQELLGHSDGSVTDRYTHRTEESLETARKLLQEFRIEQAQKIKAEQKRILEKGWDSDNASEDLVSKFFPGI